MPGRNPVPDLGDESQPRPAGDRIRNLRRALGISSQKELAAAAGIGDRSVFKAEQGTPLEREKLNSIARTLGVGLHEILEAQRNRWTTSFDELVEAAKAARSGQPSPEPEPAQPEPTPSTPEPASARPGPPPMDAAGRALAERLYWPYRSDIGVPRADTSEVAYWLAERHGCRPLELWGRAYPVTVVWQNQAEAIAPDEILGDLNPVIPPPLSESLHLDPTSYAQARALVFQQLRFPGNRFGDVEGYVYPFTELEFTPAGPRIHGKVGHYFDNLLTQYALEWELRRAIHRLGTAHLDGLADPGTLPLREAIQRLGDPLRSGAGRCAAITVSTLFVFQRYNRRYICMLRRRGTEVAVSPGMWHVVPSGMFEPMYSDDQWSVTMNVWRELLEEVYDEKERIVPDAKLPDHILGRPPIRIIRSLINEGNATHVLTGLCFDLLNLRPEICTLLLVKDPRLAELHDPPMMCNWEYERVGKEGKIATPWAEIPTLVQKANEGSGFVPSGAACLGLGYDWINRNGGI
jgi:transcriptional regulator with XRE-family HTH domain